MASQAQIEANRRNSVKSTGPKTRTGKRIVSKNAMRHGLLSTHGLLLGESEDEFVAFRDRLERELAPEGEIEGIMAEKIIWLAWLMERASRMEAALQRFRTHGQSTNPVAVKMRQDLRNTALMIKAEHAGTTVDDLPDDLKLSAEEMADSQFFLGAASSAWATGVELIEGYQAKIERRWRKLLREFEQRQAARRAKDNSKAVQPAALPDRI
jgi:hypothetical protein